MCPHLGWLTPGSDAGSRGTRTPGWAASGHQRSGPAPEREPPPIPGPDLGAPFPGAWPRSFPSPGAWYGGGCPSKGVAWETPFPQTWSEKGGSASKGVTWELPSGGREPGRDPPPPPEAYRGSPSAPRKLAAAPPTASGAAPARPPAPHLPAPHECERRVAAPSSAAKPQHRA